jgi:DNA-binding NarL/FixJ family response regulator
MKSDDTYRIRLMIVDDHTNLRFGVRKFIESQPDMIVCGEAESVSDALAKVTELQPDVATVDYNLGKECGLDLIRPMLILNAALKIIMLSMHEDAFYVERAAAAGAHGYVKKRMVTETLIPAIRMLVARNL